MSGTEANERLSVEVVDPMLGGIQGEIVDLMRERIVLRFVAGDAPVCGLGDTVKLLFSSQKESEAFLIESLVNRRDEIEDSSQYEFEFVDPDAVSKLMGPELRDLVHLSPVSRAQPGPGEVLPVTFESEWSGGDLQGEISDISPLGMAVTVEGWAEGGMAKVDDVRLSFDLPFAPHKFQVRGRIRHRSMFDGAFRYGIAFDAASTENMPVMELGILHFVRSRQREGGKSSFGYKARKSIQSKISRSMWFVAMGFIFLAVLTILYINGQFSEERVTDRLARAEATYEDRRASRRRILQLSAESIGRMPILLSALESGSIDSAEVNELARGFAKKAKIDLVVLTDSSGGVLANSRYPGAIGGKWNDESTVWEGTDSVFVVASAPVQTGGRELGRVITGRKMDTELAKEIRNSTHTDVLLVHEGKYLGGFWEEEVVEFPGQVELAGLAVLRDSDAYPRVRLCGQDRFVAVIPLGEDTLAVLSLSVSDLMGIYHVLLLWVVGAAAIIGGLSFWLSRYIAKKLARPVQDITRAAREFAEGNLNASVDESDAEELAVLGDSFNRMARRIEQLLNDVQRKTQLVESQKAELKVASCRNDLLSVVSHELQTPLTSILSYAEILLKFAEDEDPEVRREFLEIIAEQSARLSRLVDQLLDQARLQTGMMSWQITEMDLADVVRKSVRALVGPDSRTPTSVTINTPDYACPYLGDADRIHQVVTNLVANGMKFSPDELVVDFSDSENGYELRVADRGLGVAPEDRERIFEKFVQVGDSMSGHPGGTGLGLSISHQIVTVHGGRIHCEENAEGGAVFVVHLPLPDAEDLRPVDVLAGPPEKAAPSLAVGVD